MLGQINLGDVLGDIIHKLALDEQYLNYVEIGTWNGLGDNPSNAFFRIEDEVYPGLSPLGCFEVGVEFGVQQGGLAVADGGYLSVGPITGAADPYGGENGNFISCSADNVLAVGEENVLSGRNSAAIGFGNQVLNTNQLAAGHSNIIEAKSSVAFGASNIIETGSDYAFASGFGTTVKALFCQVPA